MSDQQPQHDADGAAALGICESLLLALTDLNILSEDAVRDLLTDVASAHSDPGVQPDVAGKHAAVVVILQRILDGKNGIRHPG
jgi:hypothetical protein